CGAFRVQEKVSAPKTRTGLSLISSIHFVNSVHSVQMNRKRVVILGATGSIGESALTVARDIPERMEIVGLAAKSNAEKLAAAANEVRPESVCLVDETQLDVLRRVLEYNPKIYSGESGLLEIACLTNANMVL